MRTESLTSSMNRVALLVLVATVMFLLACVRAEPPRWAVSTPSELCDDPSLGTEDFCMPSSRIEGWLRSGEYRVTDAAVASGGTTAPHKLRLEVEEGGRVLSFSVKFKAASDSLDVFNNSPRRELAAYEVQKLFLSEDEYVVPPTVVACLPVERYGALVGDLEPFPGSDCALGVMAYWAEHVTDHGVYEKDRLARDPLYRNAIANLNVLTVLIGHQDNIGSNFLLTKEETHPRLLAIDNGLSFGAMGANPMQLFSSAWSSFRVDALPARTVARLAGVRRHELDRLEVLAQLERRGTSLADVPASRPLEPTDGVRDDGRTIQLGLTEEEVALVEHRVAGILHEIESRELSIAP
jgi:hypothetical protein